MEEIICVLDISGSMFMTRDDALGGFNQFVDDQLAIRDANLTVVFFDNKFEVHYEGKLSEFPKLTSWTARGTTALYDAIGKTFSHVGPRLRKENPKKVIMAILTDGMENASVEHTEESVSALVKEYQNTCGWDVIFLAADQDAWTTALNLGIKRGDTHTYSSKETKTGFATYSTSVGSKRL